MNTIITAKTANTFKVIALFIALLLSCSTTAFALDLETARSKGLAGEVDNGFLAIPPGATAEAQALINTVNQERKTAYAALATKNNVSIEVAGQLTFEKRYPGFPAGTWVEVKGKWAKKQ
jgi:hypothetical protein